MKLITLTTDFGLKDGYAGVMKGVILGIAPDVQIIDITHNIGPQNIMEGALALSRAVPFFPPGTIHIAVVDPGVGTSRRALAAQLGAHWFVAPDNGLLTAMLEQAERLHEAVELVHLDQPRFWLPEISNSFHGRDIFAPVGAALANGTPLAELGSPIDDPVRLPVPVPYPIDKGWRGQVIQIDHFGNLETNIKRQHLQGLEPIQVRFGNQIINRLVRSFGESQPGKLVGLIDSSDYLSLCVVNGSASDYLQARVGDPVEVVRYGKTGTLV
jgi:hypothetical protein